MNLRLELDGLRILGLRASLGFRFRARNGLGIAKFALKPVGLLKFALKLGCNGKVKAKLLVIKKARRFWSNSGPGFIGLWAFVVQAQL